MCFHKLREDGKISKSTQRKSPKIMPLTTLKYSHRHAYVANNIKIDNGETYEACFIIKIITQMVTQQTH